MNIPEFNFENTTFIINPNRNPKRVKKLQFYLGKSKKTNVIIANNKEHFVKSVQKFYYNYNHYLIIFGGDGTIHTAINALAYEKKIAENNNLKNKAIGFLRGGSGNGIQESYEVAYSLRQELIDFEESIKNNYIIPIDILKIKSGNLKFYSQLVGIGIDAQIINIRNENKFLFGKRKGMIKHGFYNYIKSFLKYFIQKNNFISQYKIEFIDGHYIFFGTRVNAQYNFTKLKRNVDVPLIEIASRPYYGNFFKICPYVICNDGFLDTYLYGFQNKLGILSNLVNIYLGRHHKINKKYANKNKGIIEHYKSKSIKIISSNSFLFHSDGELFHAQKNKESNYSVKVTVLPSKLRFLVPPIFYKKFNPF